jgi:ABC-type branched-subunit amino acid transport system substrate-binding protein
MRVYAFLFFFSLSASATCLKVGVLGEFSTTTSRTSYPYGQEIYRGLEIAKSTIKKACFDLVKIDINNNIANVDSLIRKSFKENSIRYFIGLGTSEQAHAATQAINDTGAILLTPTATDDDLLRKSKNIVLLSSPNSLMARRIAIEAKKRGLKTVAIIYGQNNVYSQSMAGLFEAEAKKVQLNVGYKGGIRIGRRTKIEGINLDEIKKSDAVFLPIFEHDVVKVFGFLHKNDALSYVIGTDSWGSDSKIISTLPDFVKKKILFSITPYDPSQGVIKENSFYKKYSELHGSIPMDIAAFSFEALSVLEKKHNKEAQIKYLGTTGEVQIINNVAHRDIFVKSL